MNDEALRQLRRVLLVAATTPKPAVGFDMGSWFVGGGPDHKAELKDLIEMRCGSTACALGHAALDPWFKDRGLHIELRTPDRVRPYFEPVHANRHGMMAACHFFDLDFRDAEFLFEPCEYVGNSAAEISPMQVIERVDWLLKHGSHWDFEPAEE